MQAGYIGRRAGRSESSVRARCGARGPVLFRADCASGLGAWLRADTISYFYSPKQSNGWRASADTGENEPTDSHGLRTQIF